MAENSCAGWLRPGLSLNRDLQLRAARLAVPRMSRPDLEARMDSALVELVATQELLDQAMRRVAELEIREAMGRPSGNRRRAQVAEVLAGMAGMGSVG